MRDEDTDPACPRPAKPDALRDEEPVQLDHDARGTAQIRQAPAFWQGIVGRTETVLWFGQPDPALAGARAGRRRTSRPVAALACGLGIVIGLAPLLNDAVPLTGRLLGLAFAALCGGLMARTLSGSRGTEAPLHYLLSDRAAYIARLHSGEPPDSHRIEITAALTVHASDTSVRFLIGTTSHDGRSPHPIYAGFNDIRDAAQVRALVRNIQKGMQ